MKSQELQYRVFDWLRFPLMVLVMLIHVNLYMEPIRLGVVNLSSLTTMDACNLFRASISHVLAHVAVPLFFFISGYLFFKRLQEWDWTEYATKLKRRVRTLLVPYLIWNTIAILVYVLIDKRMGSLSGVWDFIGQNGYLKLYWSAVSWNGARLNWFGLPAYMTGPFLVPLWFLRDLMVMAVLSPLLWCLFRYLKGWGLLLIVLCHVSLLGVQGFTSTTVVFFGAGAYCSINGIDSTRWTWKFRYYIYAAALVLWVAVTCCNGYLTPMGNKLFPFFEIIGAMALFNLATALVRKGSRIHPLLSGSAFFIYVTHTVLFLRVGCAISRRVFSSGDALSLGAHYLLSALLTVALCVACYWLLRKVTPRLCSLLTGQR